MGPTYYQRLQKFVIDTVYSVSTGPSDVLTLQPLDGGKSGRGGLRVGEINSSVSMKYKNFVSRFNSATFPNCWKILQQIYSPKGTCENSFWFGGKLQRGIIYRIEIISSQISTVRVSILKLRKKVQRTNGSGEFGIQGF